MHRSLPARYFDERRMGSDKAMNIARATEHQVPPPIGLNEASVEFAEAIAIKQITAGSESAHHFVTSAANIAPSHLTEHVRNHD